MASLYSGHVIRHQDEIVSKYSAGLFVMGGNPIYYTAKGSSEDVAKEMHAVLKSHLDNLAGHHVVLKISSSTQYMGNFNWFLCVFTCMHFAVTTPCIQSDPFLSTPNRNQTEALEELSRCHF